MRALFNTLEQNRFVTESDARVDDANRALFYLWVSNQVKSCIKGVLIGELCIDEMVPREVKLQTLFTSNIIVHVHLRPLFSGCAPP